MLEGKKQEKNPQFLDVIIALWLGKKMSVLLEKYNEVCRGKMTQYLELTVEPKWQKLGYY